MKAAYVKCLYCGERFNRNDLNIPTKQVSARRYAHLSCWEKHQSEMSKEERDMEAFFEYVRNLFKEDYNHILTKKLAERYVKENNYSYSGMLKTLKWYYEKEGHDISKGNGSIGIIPYIYNQALEYYYALYKAQKVNASKDVSQYIKSPIREITIESPRTFVPSPHLWLEEDDEE